MNKPLTLALFASLSMMPSCHKKSSDDDKPIRHPDGSVINPVPDQEPLKLADLSELSGGKLELVSTTGAPDSHASQALGNLEGSEYLFTAEIGLDNPEPNRIVFYDLSKQEWQDASNPVLPISRDSPALLANEQTLFVSGGFGSDHQGTTGSQLFSFKDHSWKRLADEGQPTARGQAQALAYGDKVVVFGGYKSLSENSPLIDGGIFDPIANTWTAIPPIPLTSKEKRAMHFAGQSKLIGDILYVLLGEHLEQGFEDLWTFNMKTMSWGNAPFELTTSLDESFHILHQFQDQLVVWQNSLRPAHPPVESLFLAPTLSFFKDGKQLDDLELNYTGSAGTVMHAVAPLDDDKILVTVRKKIYDPEFRGGIVSLKDRSLTPLAKFNEGNVVWNAAGNYLVGYFQSDAGNLALVAYDWRKNAYFRLPETGLNYRRWPTFKYSHGKLILWGGIYPSEGTSPDKWNYARDGVIVTLPSDPAG